MHTHIHAHTHNRPRHFNRRGLDALTAGTRQLFILRTQRSKHTMQTILPACLLLLWTLTASVSCQETAPITVKTISDGIVLSCGNNKYPTTNKGQVLTDGKLEYKDANTGEYTCEEGERKIFVKFRKCENCIEFDSTSIAGLAVGNVVSTIVIGVAVYLIASQNRISPTTSHKSSDRQPLVLNEGSSRAPNDHYQQLKHKGGQRDMYDVLNNTNRR